MQNQYNRSSRASLGHIATGLLLVSVLLLTMGFGGLFFSYYQEGSPLAAFLGKKEPAVAAPTEPTPEIPTEPVLTVVRGNDDKTDLCYAASYSVSPEQAADVANMVVARAGNAKLTNAQLQSLYLKMLASKRDSEWYPKPNFEEPLENQLCEHDTSLSWQHYFLSRALRHWYLQQVLIAQSKKPQPVTEEAFQPNVYQDLHTPNIKPDLPVNNFLYQDLPYYTPNAMHQAYLDSLEETMEAVAAAHGYESLAKYAAEVFGDESYADILVEQARELNLSYMYFTERSYYAEVTDEQVAAAVKKKTFFVPDDWEDTVDIRHMLLIPVGAKVDADGKVTATEEQWEDCRTEAETLLQAFLWEYPTNMNEKGMNANFSRWAYTYSKDYGSDLNGGLYSGVRKGQLISELDSWAFNKKRQPNDYDIIRTDAGIHIVLFVGSTPAAESKARYDLLWQWQWEDIESFMENVKLKVDYSAIALWVDPTAVNFTMDEIVYPDVAHERFTEAMVFLQQDYATTSYGSSTVGRGGCGITTMAMLSTYLLDELHTPAMLAKDYSNYHDESGTMAEMFKYVPAELGFQLEKQCFNVEEVIKALQSNKRVVSLQYFGHFTSAGHYLLLQKYYPDNDTFQVRDSNIANYGKLSGHKVDYFTRENILSGGTNFFIFPEKVVRIPACSRCGDECEKQPNRLVMADDYLCERCHKALMRRDRFLGMLDQ